MLSIAYSWGKDGDCKLLVPVLRILRPCVSLKFQSPSLPLSTAHERVHQLEGRHTMNTENKSNRAEASAGGKIPTRTPLPLPLSQNNVNVTGTTQRNAKVMHALVSSPFERKASGYTVLLLWIVLLF